MRNPLQKTTEYQKAGVSSEGCDACFLYRENPAIAAEFKRGYADERNVNKTILSITDKTSIISVANYMFFSCNGKNCCGERAEARHVICAKSAGLYKLYGYTCNSLIKVFAPLFLKSGIPTNKLIPILTKRF